MIVMNDRNIIRVVNKIENNKRSELIQVLQKKKKRMDKTICSAKLSWIDRSIRARNLNPARSEKQG